MAWTQSHGLDSVRHDQDSVHECESQSVMNKSVMIKTQSAKAWTQSDATWTRSVMIRTQSDTAWTQSDTAWTQ